MQREQRVTVWPAGPAAGPTEAVLSPHCGLRASRVGRREGHAAQVSDSASLRAHTVILAEGSSQGRAGGGAGRQVPGGWAGLAQVLLVALDRLLDAKQHGGEPLVQPGDGVILLHRLGVAVHVLLLMGF